MQRNLLNDIMESKGVMDPEEQARITAAIGIILVGTPFLSDAEMVMTLEVMQQHLKATLALQVPGMVMEKQSQVTH